MTGASYLSCYTCGLEEPFLNCTSTTENTTTDNGSNMRRASSSRREQALMSPPARARSSERLESTRENLDQENDLLAEEADRLAESTDNDSIAASLSYSDDDEKVLTTPKAKQQQLQQQQHASVRSSTRRMMHERAMSDPFDTQEVKDAILQVQKEDEVVQQAMAYPTLRRYPVAETRNKNCWSEPPVTIFSVRGSKYFTNKKKQTSGPYLLAARGADIFLFDKPIRLQERFHLILGGHLRKVPTLLINFKFPWGVMVLYFEIPAKLEPYLKASTPLASNLTTAERTLAKWFQGNEDYKNDRLKLIPYVAEGPWVVRNMVTGRPAIIGRKLPVTHRTIPQQGASAPLVEVTLDIGSSSATAKRIVSVCRRYMSGLTADIGFVIQGETPGELPEQMMGSIRVHGPDPLKSPKI